MTKKELLEKMKGTREDKIEAFNYLLDESLNVGLDDSETAMMEYLRTEVVTPVSMTAALEGKATLT